MGRVAASLAAALTALALAACGGGDGAEPDAPSGATLVLDFQPNAVHAPLYAAARPGGYIADAGVDLQIREPSSAADGAKLLETGRADMAILDVNDLGIARARGLDVVAVAALVQRPLASVITADPQRIATPSDLDGASVGITGVPSDDAVLDTVLEAGGVAPGSVDRVTIGFAAVPALAAGRVDAATAFWNAEGVELRQEGIATGEFRVDELGAPRYPELVVVARGDRAPDDADVVCPVLDGLSRAYDDLEQDPDASLDALLEEVRQADPDSQRAQFAELIASDAFSPRDDGRANPALTAEGYRGWFEWASERGVIGQAASAETIREGFAIDQIRACATG
ncbi:MAG: transporter substrate-binding protein [Solirubrobacterales bacterium]|nr:transporter substrate-binding protein [Solirubrobacterales bacterium]